MNDNVQTEQEKPTEVEASELPDLLSGTTRYDIKGSSLHLGFSGPEVETRQELGKLLEDAGKALQAEGTQVVGECCRCMRFILEGEKVTHSALGNLCSDCA